MPIKCFKKIKLNVLSNVWVASKCLICFLNGFWSCLLSVYLIRWQSFDKFNLISLITCFIVRLFKMYLRSPMKSHWLKLTDGIFMACDCFINQFIYLNHSSGAFVLISHKSWYLELHISGWIVLVCIEWFRSAWKILYQKEDEVHEEWRLRELGEHEPEENGKEEKRWNIGWRNWQQGKCHVVGIKISWQLLIMCHKILNLF